MVEKNNYSTNSTLSSLWKRRSVKFAMFLAAFIVLFLIALPIGARLYLQKWFVENGADKATIEKVRLNPFTGVAALYGVDIQKSGKTVFSNSVIFVDIGLRNLSQHEAYLQKVSLVDLIVDIEQYDDSSLRVASYSIPPGKDDNVEKSSDIVEELGENIPWIFRAKEIGLDNVTIRYGQPGLDVELVIEEALLAKFNTDPNDTEGTLTLKGTFNGAPLVLDLSTLQISPEMKIKGKIDMAGVHLDGLAEVLGEFLKPFSGISGIKGNIDFTMIDTGSLDVDYDGLINLENGKIGGEGWATKGTIDWDGKVSFSMKPEKIVVDVDGSLKAFNAGFDMPDPVIDIDNSDINIIGKTTVTISEEVVVETNASLALAGTTYSMDFLDSSTGNTSWKGEVRVETGTELEGLVVRADGKLQVSEPGYSMDIDGALMKVGNDMLSFDGTVEYIMGVGSDSTSYVRTDGTLLGEAIQFSLPKTIQISQSKLDLTGKTEVAMGQNTTITYDGDVLFDETGVEMTGVSLDEKKFSWSGQIEYLLGKQSQKITLGGDLQTEGILVGLEEAGLQIKQEFFKSKNAFSLLLEESPSFAGEISIEGGGLEINQEDTPLLSLAEISMSKARDNGTGGLVVDSLMLSGLDMPSSQKIPVSVSVPSVTVSGIRSPDLASVDVTQLIVEKPEIADSDKKMLLAQLESITADTIRVSRDISTTVGQVTVSKGNFLKEKDKDPMAVLGLLTVKQISYSLEQGFSCNTIDLDSVFGNITRQKSEKSEKDQEENSVSGTEKPKKAAGLPVKIKEINITGSSGFRFTDNTLTESFLTTFTLESLQVRDINLTDPEHPFTYSLKGASDKYSLLGVDGTAAPLADNIFLEQQATLQNYSMLNASPYTIEAIGTYFPSGRLDLTSSLKIADGRIDMENNLLFKELVAETVKGELADKLNNQLPVSLDLALTMLRDGEGTIDLNIPLEGELDDMSIDVTDIIITALGKGISVAVLPYLAYTTLGPAGALAFVGAKVGASLLHSDLPSLEFEPGGTELTESHSEILDKVGKSIEKDKKSYSICAKVSLEELHQDVGSADKKNQNKIPEAARKELFELGETRSLAVKEYLVSHFQIDEKQLLICNPGINFEDGDKPRIEFKQ